MAERSMTEVQTPKPLDPELAARIKQLGLPEWYGLTSDQEHQRIYMVEQLKFTLISVISPIALIIASWLTYRSPIGPKLISVLAESPYFYMLWPRNPRYSGTLLAHGRLLTSETQFLFVMTSTASAIMMAWLLCCVTYFWRHRSTFYLHKLLRGAMVVAGIITPLLLINDFSEWGRRAPRIDDPIPLSTSKFVLLIVGAYFVLAFVLFAIILYIRRDKTIPPFQL